MILDGVKLLTKLNELMHDWVYSNFLFYSIWTVCQDFQGDAPKNDDYCHNENYGGGKK